VDEGEDGAGHQLDGDRGGQQAGDPGQQLQGDQQQEQAVGPEISVLPSVAGSVT
jgi:hypothetical protein